MQEESGEIVKKVTKKSNSKMSKSQKAPNSLQQQNFSNSPQNVRLDTSESDEESVSEILLACLCLRPDLLESFPQENDDISTEEFPEDEETCESENDDQEEDVSDEELDSDDNNTEDEDSDVTADECGQPSGGPTKKFLLDIDDEQAAQQLSKQTRIETLLEASASKDKRGNPVLRCATAALDEAAQTITRMRSDASPRDKNLLSRTLIEACTDNDVNAVRRLLVEGNNLNDTDDGDSLLSLACSAGYYELAQVLLAMSAQVEDRGQKNDCTPLMEAASAGHIEIIELLIRHGADVNAQSSTGNTPLMYACAGGHVEAVKILLAHGANVEDHNENGHTPLMEAASAGHVEVAKILLDHGAGINTHSNEFKESALTLACYKGHLDMVRFLLEAGADQEHKTDEMHTALMEASMDGHVEVARLLLDSGAQVNMPTDSFESPLTLAACGGHVDLAMLLIERGANIEEVNDEGYTPLMEAAREGHEEMVSLLLSQGANINAQTEETQETALTLACCGGFLEVADYLIKHGADIELGASTPLMEASQEGHLELVKFLLDNKANVHAQTQTGDTALTYACENGHTDVAEVLLYYGAELEHLSEGGRTPLMKACRAGHICTVKFLIQKGANVNRPTTNNDHTPLSLACAGGHQQVVELLLAHIADPYHKLKDNSTMLIEAAKGGHTGVVQLLLDYPTSISTSQQQQQQHQQQQQQQQSLYIPAQVSQQAQLSQLKQHQQLKMLQQSHQQQQQPQQPYMITPPGMHEEVIRLQDPPGIFQSQPDMMPNHNYIIDQSPVAQHVTESSIMSQMKLLQSTGFKDGLAYGLTKGQNAVSQIINQQQNANNNSIACNSQQQPLVTNNLCMSSSFNKQKNVSRKKCSSGLYNEIQPTSSAIITEEENASFIKHSGLDKLDNTLQKNIQFINDSGPPPTLLPSGTYVDITTAAQNRNINLLSNTLVPSNVVATAAAASTTTTTMTTPMNKTTQLTTKSEVSQSTAISDRPKAKAKNSRKNHQQQQQQQQQQQSTQQQKSATTVNKSELDNVQFTLTPNTIQEIYQQTQVDMPSASADEKAVDGSRAYSLVDFEPFQKNPVNNLSNRSAHWDPKVFKKIAQLIDPPKSPSETSQAISRPDSPEEKKLENEYKSILDEVSQSGVDSLMKDDQAAHDFCASSMRAINAEQFVNCDGSGAYPTLEQTIESFNADEMGDHGEEDSAGPIYNYEWVDEVMQALNVSPDISNAFHEIAANINNQDLEQYANFFGLNSICKSKWSAPLWPPNQIASDSMSPLNEQGENIIIQNEGEGADEKHDDSNLLMIDQSGYTPQFTVEQLQLLSQLQQQQHPPLQIDPHTAQNIFMHGASIQVSPSNVQMQKLVADAQQQQATKYVLNVDGEKNSQSLQLLFQLPNEQQQQQQQQQQHPQIIKVPNLSQKVQQNVAQTQTMPLMTSQSLPQIISHQQSFLNFQLQQQQMQHQPLDMQIMQQQQQQLQQPQQQKIPQVTGVNNKSNFQQVQVATQTQSHAIDLSQQQQQQQQHHHQHHQQQQQQLQQVMGSGKTTNLLQGNATNKKSFFQSEQKRKEKSRVSTRQANSNANHFQYDQQQMQYANANIPGSMNATATDRAIEIDSETDSNHDTALTLACAGGHEELVELLLSRKANIEHRDKKGFTPLILAATAGHEKVVEILINNGADLEAQSERTKDTPLSLACSGGRYEVVELLLRFGANKEHRNVSDYTPLSLAASGGYVNIIKLLLNHGAEINSRTGSKLGISPLMLAAMNGHTAAVRLLLDMGSDINAQIETNRNTALTLACFQGRHEVVNLLLDRKANVEHRAKTGLTPLMEAASGGYIEVGRVLLDKNADVNAAPVPSSRDTALTIAADKGHLKFVELLLSRGAAVEVKNKKGNSPLWLAANGGHLGVVEALYHAKADIDSQDNRKVSCLMAAFRKGHVKVIKWMVNHVSQFPSDQEMTRYISVVDKEIVDKCHECVKIIRAAKETQAAKANINASILLKELDMEKSREDARKAAAAKRRERKKRRKQEKREAQRKANGESTKADGKENSGNQKAKGANSNKYDKADDTEESEEEEEEEDSNEEEPENDLVPDREGEGDSGIEQGSCSSSDAAAKSSNTTAPLATQNSIKPEPLVASSAANQSGGKSAQKNNNKNQKRSQQEPFNKISTKNNNSNSSNNNRNNSPLPTAKQTEVAAKSGREEISVKKARDQKKQQLEIESRRASEKENHSGKQQKQQESKEAMPSRNQQQQQQYNKKTLVYGNSRNSAPNDEYDAEFTKHSTAVSSAKSKTAGKPSSSSSNVNATAPPSISAPNSASKAQPFRGGGEDEWKEVGRKLQSVTSSASNATSIVEIGCKKIQVPLNAISRVIGRGGSNINAIRAATGAHIEVEKQGKSQEKQNDRSITIKGVPEATKQAHNLISALVKDPDADILSMLPRNNFQPTRSASGTSIMSPSSLATINNGTSVWEKSLNTIPTVTNPVKPASYAAPLKSSAPPSAGVPSTTAPSGKSSTPTQQLNSSSSGSSNNNNTGANNFKNQRTSVAKNLFSANAAIVRPTPTPTSSSSKILLVQDGAKKGIMSASNGFLPASASKVIASSTSNGANASSNFPSSDTFASKLNSSNEMTSDSILATQGVAAASATALNQSPLKQQAQQQHAAEETSTSKSLHNESQMANLSHSHTSSTSTASTAVAAGGGTTLTRSITPIGPPTRISNASPHTSHIVNTLDLSTPYNNPIASHSVIPDLTTQIQSKLSELHVSAQGLEYSLFDNCKNAWPTQEQSMTFSESRASFIDAPPQQVFDASKAPGYRGACINSPVSSKTSSNSATPPSTILATQAPTVNPAAASMSQSSVKLSELKPIGQGSSGAGGGAGQNLGPVSRPSMNRGMDAGFARTGAIFEGFESSEPSSSSSSYGPINFANLNPVSISRLNPKASAFSTSNSVHNNKMNSNQYGSVPSNNLSSSNNNYNSSSSSNNNNNYMTKSPGGSMSAQQQQQQQQQQQNFHLRGSLGGGGGPSTSASRWLSDFGSQPFNTMQSAMDFMTTGSSSSPTISPNNNSLLNVATNMMDDARKAPRPIGTERHNFKYNSYQFPQQHMPNNNVMELENVMQNASWLDAKHSQQQQQQQQQWQAPSNVAVIPRNANPYDTSSSSDYNMIPDLFPPYSIEQQMGYARNNGPAAALSNNPYHPNNMYINELSNLDLQQSPYEKQQPWTAKWTH